MNIALAFQDELVSYWSQHVGYSMISSAFKSPGFFCDSGLSLLSPSMAPIHYILVERSGELSVKLYSQDVFRQRMI